MLAIDIFHAHLLCCSAYIVDINTPLGCVGGVHTKLVQHRSNERVKRTDAFLVLYLDERVGVSLHNQVGMSREWAKA